MRRARHKLQVDNFPFLAVLLGAMGALIFLLLIMDYRAKIVARNKAEEARRKHQDDRAAQLAKLQAEQQAEWERRRQDLLAALQGEHELVRSQADQRSLQLRQAALDLEQTQAARRKLEEDMRGQQTLLERERLALLDRQKSLAVSLSKNDLAQLEKDRLSRQLLELEKTLELLKNARKGESNVYSLVPYGGKHGQDRKPIYVECRGERLIFHPDGLALTGDDLNIATFRREVKARGAELIRAKKPEDNRPPLPEPPLTSPYVLFLVRPEGVKSFYGAAAALDGYRIDFGYEFIDAAWELDFGGQRISGLASAPPPVLPARSSTGFTDSTDFRKAGPPGAFGNPATGPGSGPGGIPNNGARLGAPLPGVAGVGNDGQPGGQFSGGTAPGIGSGPGVGLGQGKPGPGAPGFVGDGPRLLPPQTNLPGAAKPGNTSSSSGDAHSSLPARSAALGMPHVPGSTSGNGAPGDPGVQQPPRGANPSNGKPPAVTAPPSKDQDLTWKGASKSGVNQGPGQGTQDPNGRPGQPRADQPKPKSPQEKSDQPPSDDPPPEGARPGQPGDANQPYDPLSRLAPPPLLQDKAGPRIAPPPLGRLAGNRDFVITIACTDANAVVLPGSTVVPMVGGRDQPAHDQALVKTVLTMIARRQAVVRPGETPYRPLLRFQVYPEGLRTYYRVYPLFENLNLPMSRENVE